MGEDVAEICDGEGGVGGGVGGEKEGGREDTEAAENIRGGVEEGTSGS